MSCGRRDPEVFGVIAPDELSPNRPTAIEGPSSLGESNADNAVEASTSVIQDQAAIDTMELEDSSKVQAATEVFQALIASLKLQTNGCSSKVPTQTQWLTTHATARTEQQPRALVAASYINSAEEDLAKTAAKLAIDYVQERLLKYLVFHGISADADIGITINSHWKLAKKAFISVTGFDCDPTVWKAAWRSHKESRNECLNQIRRSNNNSIRR